jgi:hypothetical protein
MHAPRIGVLVFVCLLAGCAWAQAQGVTGTVVDQTGSALPGATVKLLVDEAVVATITTDGEGRYQFEPALNGTAVEVSLNGFETTRVTRAESDRITLALARTTHTTSVTAPTEAAALPTSAAMGNTLTPKDVTRLPSKNFKARESLPLLPGVMRGPDGLMQLGGVRAHDTPLFLDGFNVTDPATGISNINLPYETVRGIDLLRDPMAVTYGDLLGGLVSLESRTGGDEFKWGVQSVVPRPRFQSPGLFRIEGIFPRVYAMGANRSGSLRYTTALEYDYERIPVPGVTQGSGPDIVEESATGFLRLDGRINERQSFTAETLLFPSHTGSHGLSPRRDQEATFNLDSTDLFAGFTHRYIVGDGSVVKTQIGAFGRGLNIQPNGEGTSVLTPDGWHGNWFATAHRHAKRFTAAIAWERAKKIGRYTHDFTTSLELAGRSVSGTLTELPIRVEDATGAVVRTITFGPSAALSASDRRFGTAFRDLWQLSSRTQIDAGLRVDGRKIGGTDMSARAGLRHAINDVTVVKFGYGKFVGTVPLGVPAFANYPVRVDRRFDADTGEQTDAIVLVPTLGEVHQPVAVAATLTVERQIKPTLDAQVVLTRRRSDRLATLRVPKESGLMIVESTGAAEYQEAQFSLRKTWPDDQQLFVSYVRSDGRGEINDFTSLFGFIDAPLVQPGAFARLSTEAKNRVLAWGTVNLPRRVVVSPVAEWRSGFPYSVLDHQYVYSDVPNTRRFPTFFAADLVAYKTVTVRGRDVDVGAQLFNFTNHRNPRDVYSVTNAPRFGEFANSVGVILRGYMLVKW